MFGFLKRKKELPNSLTPKDERRVNCIHLSPPTTAVGRPHCNTGNAEGDCPIFLKKSKDCSFREPRYMPLTKEQILKKAQKIEERKAYERQCLDAGICPDCGYELELEYWREFADGICPICSKTWNI